MSEMKDLKTLKKLTRYQKEHKLLVTIICPKCLQPVKFEVYRQQMDPTDRAIEIKDNLIGCACGFKQVAFGQKM